jgi:hypothetical protein
MKVPALALVPLASAAFAAGWWLRGGEPAARVGESGATAPARSVGRSAAERPAELPKKRPRSAEVEFTEADRRRAADDRRRMEERCRAALERRIVEWERLLGLAVGEVAALRQAIDPLVAAADPPVAERVLPALEERLRAMSGGERQAALDQLSQRRGEAVRRAKAQARLADLNAVLLLDPAQEQALGELLMDHGDTWMDTAPSGELSPQALAEISTRLTAATDGSDFAGVAREVVREGIEATLKPLGGLLSADQLESYSAHLEERYARWLLPPP